MILEEIKEQLKKWSSTPPSEKPIFHCPICNQIYYTMEETMACLNRKAEPGPFKVGDIVMVSGKWVGYGNYPNDPWLACTRPAEPRAESHFDQVDQHWPWFVITSLWNEAHREVASLVTLLGGEIRFHGWNPTAEHTHCAIWLEGQVKGWPNNIPGYWEEHFQNVEIKPPSKRLRKEAAELAAEGYVFRNLI